MDTCFHKDQRSLLNDQLNYPANIGSNPHTTIWHVTNGKRVVFGTPITIPIGQDTINVHHRRLLLTLSDDDLMRLDDVKQQLNRYIDIMHVAGKLYAIKTYLHDFVDDTPSAGSSIRASPSKWTIKLPHKHEKISPGIINVAITGFDVKLLPEGPTACIRTIIGSSTDL